MSRIIIWVVFLLLINNFIVYSQSFDSNWLIGYSDGTIDAEDEFGVTKIGFGKFGKMNISNEYLSPVFFDGTDVSISDENGQLEFYYNGLAVFNASHSIMENGDTLNIDNSSGRNIPQGGLILPWPDHPGMYYLFHLTGEYIGGGTGFIGTSLFYSIIDMNLNNGLGAITKRKVKLIDGNLFYGKITSVKHANGRDWWILLPDQTTNKSDYIYSLYLSPSGIIDISKQKIELSILSGLGQSAVSPDGNYLAYIITIIPITI